MKLALKRNRSQSLFTISFSPQIKKIHLRFEGRYIKNENELNIPGMHVHSLKNVGLFQPNDWSKLDNICVIISQPMLGCSNPKFWIFPLLANIAIFCVS